MFMRSQHLVSRRLRAGPRARRVSCRPSRSRAPRGGRSRAAAAEPGVALLLLLAGGGGAGIEPAAVPVAAASARRAVATRPAPRGALGAADGAAARQHARATAMGEPCDGEGRAARAPCGDLLGALAELPARHLLREAPRAALERPAAAPRRPRDGAAAAAAAAAWSCSGSRRRHDGVKAIAAGAHRSAG